MKTTVRKVIVKKSPVTERYVSPGDRAEIHGDQIRVGWAWFPFDPDRWTVEDVNSEPPKFINSGQEPEGFEPDKINTAIYNGYKYSWASPERKGDTVSGWVRGGKV